MSDERKSPETGNLDEGFNEEFDFGEGETETHSVTPTPNKGGRQKLIAIIFLVVILVVAIMGYRLYSSKSAVSKPTTASVPTPKPVQTPVTPTTSTTSSAAEDEFAAALAGVTPPSAPVSTPIVINPTPAPAPVPAPTTTTTPTSTATPEKTEISKLNDGLNTLNSQIDSILSQIKYLDAYSREVSDNLNKLNDSISTMDTRLSALTNTTTMLSKDVGAVKSEVGQVKEVLKEDGLDINSDTSSQRSGPQAKSDRIAIEEPEYTVHAVVPGRAWLKSSKGQIVTVAEGDSIGDYGKILVIDAANGVVLTSSGVAFR